MALLPLLVLPVVVVLFTWIEQTVLPQTWATGEMFGLYPTRGERAIQKMAKWSAIGCATMWWVLVISILVALAS